MLMDTRTINDSRTAISADGAMIPVGECSSCAHLAKTAHGTDLCAVMVGMCTFPSNDCTTASCSNTEDTAQVQSYVRTSATAWHLWSGCADDHADHVETGVMGNREVEFHTVLTTTSATRQWEPEALSGPPDCDGDTHVAAAADRTAHARHLCHRGGLSRREHGSGFLSDMVVDRRWLHRSEARGLEMGADQDERSPAGKPTVGGNGRDNAVGRASGTCEEGSTQGRRPRQKRQPSPTRGRPRKQCHRPRAQEQSMLACGQQSIHVAISLGHLSAPAWPRHLSAVGTSAPCWVQKRTCHEHCHRQRHHILS
jgi:hypothetical protein